MSQSKNISSRGCFITTNYNKHGEGCMSVLEVT